MEIAVIAKGQSINFLPNLRNKVEQPPNLQLAC